MCGGSFGGEGGCPCQMIDWALFFEQGSTHAKVEWAVKNENKYYSGNKVGLWGKKQKNAEN